MSSTPVNWDDFASQAAHIQNMISDQLMVPESPQFITRLAEPQDLVLLSPISPPNLIDIGSENIQDDIRNKLTTSKVNGSFRAKTPLKDSSNVFSNKENVYTTPEKAREGKGSPKIQCPTSAEFKEFLTGIMEVSPVIEDIDDSKVTPVRPCNDSNKNCGTVTLTKTRTRKGTYDIAIPVDEIRSSVEQASETPLVSANTTTIKPRGRIGTYDLLDSPSILSSPDTKTSNGIPCDQDIVLTNTNNQSSHKGNRANEQLVQDKVDALLQSPSSEEDPVDTEELLIVFEGMQRVNSRTVELKKTRRKRIDHPGALGINQAPEAQSDQCGSELKTDKLAENKELEVPSCDEKPLNSSHKHVRNVTVDVDHRNENAPEVCTEPAVPDNAVVTNSGDNLKPPGTVTKQTLQPKQGRLSLSTVHNKPANKIEQRRSTGLQLKVPVTKSSIAKPSETKPLLKRQSIGSSGAKSQLAGQPVLNDDTLKAGDAGLSRTVTKPQPRVSKLVRRDSQLKPPTSKPPLEAKELQPPQQPRELKPPQQPKELKPPQQPKELKPPQQPRELKPPQQPRELKPPQHSRELKPPLKMLAKIPENHTNPSEFSNEKPKAVIKSFKKLSLGPAEVSESSNASKLSKRLSMNGATAVKQLPNMPKTFSKPSLLMNGLKGNTKDSCRDVKKIAAPSECTKKIETPKKGPAPVKAIFPTDGSRTVTKDESTALSRTVTKEDTALSRTVDISSDDAFKDAPFAGDTPLKMDKFLIPKRLSAAFYNSAVSDSANTKNGKKTSIPTPTRIFRNSSHSSSGSTSSCSSLRKPSFESPFSGIRPKKALVQNTPDVAPRRQSMWSPVKKNPIPTDDMAHFCTKRSRSGQEGAS
ncbi:histone-lysine N-methyltransferase SETD1B-like isoform X2 [Physella acuta]|uniref:histone-lysine N-methyltransferase SETD1B-like isoform X2 n=1 Tax=Physella acuta TaxID=109671 RepID=UPI0027DD385F|nr:histone-lysine N-methyltransferase SETD1B-like isoform X2 [Physella acuta]